MSRHAIQKDTVYLISPKLGGLANNTLVQTEAKQTLYNVKSKVLSLSGRQYMVTDNEGQEVLRTEQDHTIIFPRHRLLRDDTEVGVMGQAGIIPQKYSIEIKNVPRAEVHIGGLNPVFKLKSEFGVVAEIAQHRSTWITVLHTDAQAELVLLSIAVLSRENTIGGC